MFIREYHAFKDLRIFIQNNYRDTWRNCRRGKDKLVREHGLLGDTKFTNNEKYCSQHQTKQILRKISDFVPVRKPLLLEKICRNKILVKLR